MAVLVAEDITGRFLNVISLFNKAIPLVAIQLRALGKTVRPGKRCTASKRVKVTAKSIFRAVLIRPAGNVTLDHSPSLTVKLK